ncbi:hypothetical protein ADUPG1_010204 [Aduncisulcus paluster]|uniref:BEACH-type PH domain-containing protein n=1 Tax=Aduncisulcus paluster TaxID=2918883 RepID=A0ABQ5JU70_9EUKA|nr:hypothetical protein ADUPG1_010204 [Aduncisulcus paluster]
MSSKRQSKLKVPLSNIPSVSKELKGVREDLVTLPLSLVIKNYQQEEEIEKRRKKIIQTTNQQFLHQETDDEAKEEFSLFSPRTQLPRHYSTQPKLAKVEVASVIEMPRMKSIEIVEWIIQRGTHLPIQAQRNLAIWLLQHRKIDIVTHRYGFEEIIRKVWLGIQWNKEDLDETIHLPSSPVIKHQSTGRLRRARYDSVIHQVEKELELLQFRKTHMMEWIKKIEAEINQAATTKTEAEEICSSLALFAVTEEALAREIDIQNAKLTSRQSSSRTKGIIAPSKTYRYSTSPLISYSGFGMIYLAKGEDLRNCSFSFYSPLSQSIFVKMRLVNVLSLAKIDLFYHSLVMAYLTQYIGMIPSVFHKKDPDIVKQKAIYDRMRLETSYQAKHALRYLLQEEERDGDRRPLERRASTSPILERRITVVSQEDKESKKEDIDVEAASQDVDSTLVKSEGEKKEEKEESKKGEEEEVKEEKEEEVKEEDNPTKVATNHIIPDDQSSPDEAVKVVPISIVTSTISHGGKRRSAPIASSDTHHSEHDSPSTKASLEMEKESLFTEKLDDGFREEGDYRPHSLLHIDHDPKRQTTINRPMEMVFGSSGSYFLSRLPLSSLSRSYHPLIMPVLPGKSLRTLSILDRLYAYPQPWRMWNNTVEEALLHCEMAEWLSPGISKRIMSRILFNHPGVNCLLRIPSERYGDWRRMNMISACSDGNLRFLHETKRGEFLIKSIPISEKTITSVAYSHALDPSILMNTKLNIRKDMFLHPNIVYPRFSTDVANIIASTDLGLVVSGDATGTIKFFGKSSSTLHRDELDEYYCKENTSMDTIRAGEMVVGGSDCQWEPESSMDETIEKKETVDSAIHSGEPASATATPSLLRSPMSLRTESADRGDSLSMSVFPREDSLGNGVRRVSGDIGRDSLSISRSVSTFLDQNEEAYAASLCKWRDLGLSLIVDSPIKELLVDRTKLITICDNIHVYSFLHGANVITIEDQRPATCGALDGCLLATGVGCSQASIRMWDLSMGKPLFAMGDFLGILSLDLDKDMNKILVGCGDGSWGYDGRIVWMDLRTEKPVINITSKNSPSRLGGVYKVYHDGYKIISGHGNGKSRIFDVRNTAKCLAEICHHHESRRKSIVSGIINAGKRLFIGASSRTHSLVEYSIDFGL